MKRYQVFAARTIATLIAVLIFILTVVFVGHTDSLQDSQAVGLVALMGIFGWILVAISIHMTPSTRTKKQRNTKIRYINA
jgi:hypothetical protein